ncbi:MAG: DNA/RNA non-specific endonuclease [Pseudomonadota bacterium]
MQSRENISAFEIYLRTGRRMSSGIEVKFNPWHDPEDGRFTFVGSGQYFAGGRPRDSRARARGSQNQAHSRSGLSGHIGRSNDSDSIDPDYSRFDPKSPRNHSIYVVQRGDTLTEIARQRKGLTASDLAWLNEIPFEVRLRIGQRIRGPHQQFLETGREARNAFLALSYYTRTHGGKLPPDPGNPPSLESQILDTNWRRESRKGYDFQIDIMSRPRKIYGSLSLAELPERSRKNQAQAGKPDRRSSDDGGHYIAARFNGPGDGFNHFAQDANFNRGAYRALEDGWAKELRAGHTVFVDIVPHYPGTSKRPGTILITWYVDGEKHRKKLPNEPTRRPDGKR